MENKDKKYIEKLVKNYQGTEVNKLEELKALDKQVKLPITVFAYVFGSVCSLLLGFGMCLAMEVILPGFMWLGIIIGLVGIGLCVLNYFIYKKVLASRKNAYADKILDLSNEILNE